MKRVPFVQVGFTLVENALALGIAGFALVGILGLLPIAVGIARDACEKTRATFIAQSVVETLRAGEPGNATLQTRAASSAAEAVFDVIALPPAKVVTRDLGYDAEGRFIAELVDFDYSTGVGAPANTAFLTRLILTPAALRQPAEVDAAVLVEIRVERPVGAPAENRSVDSFATLLSP